MTVSKFFRRPGWLHKPSRQNLMLLIVSFVIAVVLWAYIVSSLNPTYTVTLRDIPVTVDITGSKAEGYGLSVLSQEFEDPRVDVTISGNRSAIGGLSKKDVTAYVDFDTTVTDTIGKQSLPIRISTDAAYANVELSRPTLDVTMDRYETLSFNVTEIDHANLHVADSEVIIDEEQLSCEPAAVYIKGPTTALSQIDHIRVIIDDAEDINQTKVYSNVTHFELVDEDGSTIDQTAYEVQATRFSVKIPVYYMRELPVTVGVDVKGISNDFDVEWLKSRLRINADREYALPGYTDEDSEDALPVLPITIKTESLVNKQKLDLKDSLSIGSVALSSLSLDSDPIPIEIKMEEGFTDLSNYGTVTVSLDETDLVKVTRYISNSDITVMNGAADYNYSVQTGRTAVTLIGTEEDLANVSASDIVAQVNLFNADVTDAGVFSQAVTVTLPESANRVWISPIPKVSITAAAKAESAADAEDSVRAGT